MRLIRFGDSGPDVSALQHQLNTFNSKLARLKEDGIFGDLTQARVFEFQRDSGLVADGLVGQATMAALQRAPSSDGKFFEEISRIAALASWGITGIGHIYFVRHQRALIAPLAPQPAFTAKPADSPVVGFITTPFQIAFALTPQGQLFLLLMLIMMLIIALMLMSRDPVMRRRARFWEREVEIMESSAGEKGDRAAAEEAAGKAKQIAKEYVDSKVEKIKKCRDNNFGATGACAAALREIARVMDEITRKLGLPFKDFPNIAKGIAENMAELMAALRNAAIQCKKCDDLL
jgi:Putative peptidoglycan binding domain